jgi:hypothetical protein
VIHGLRGRIRGLDDALREVGGGIGVLRGENLESEPHFAKLVAKFPDCGKEFT